MFNSPDQVMKISSPSLIHQADLLQGAVPVKSAFLWYVQISFNLVGGCLFKRLRMFYDLL